MGQNNDSGTATLKYFGRQLKLFRVRAGLSRCELGDRLGYSVATVASVEQGRRIPQQEFIEQADQCLGAGGVLTAGAPFLLYARYPSWFQDFALLEAEALSLYSYEDQVMPGLLQTGDYARAVFRNNYAPLDDDVLEERVQARLDRQALLTRKPIAVLAFVIEEVVVRRPIGGPEVLRGQLRQLVECAGLRNVTIQVMPSNRETHGGLSGPMVLLDTPDHRTLGYTEGQSGSFLVSEPEKLGELTQRYGIIRAQALGPEESVSFIDQVAGGL